MTGLFLLIVEIKGLANSQNGGNDEQGIDGSA